MMKPTLAAALLATALLAGCAAQDDAETASAPTPDDPVSQQLGEAIVAAPLPGDNATLSVGTPFLMTAQAGPDAPLTGFRYRIPEGAVIDYQPIESAPEFIFETIMFDMVPILANGTVLESFAILVFDLSEDEAFLRTTYLGVPQSGTMTFALVMSSDLSYQPVLESEFFRLSAGDLEAGDELGFVIMGKAAQPGSFGLLMSPMTEMPERDDEPSGDAVELLDGRSAATLAPSGTGAGFGFGLYLNQNIVFLTSVYNIEVTAGDVEVADTTRTPTEPLATVRQATVTTSFADAGYSEAVAEIFTTSLLTPNCVAVGTYDIQMDLHGTLVDHRNLILETPQTSAAYLITGLPIAFGTGEGPGASRVSLAFQMADSCSFEFIIVEQLDLGATLQELLGTPAATGAAAFNGIAGNLPPARAWREGDDLVRYDGGRLSRLAGLGYLADVPDSA